MEYAHVQTHWPIREYIIPALIGFVLMLCLPLLGLAAFALRTAILIIAPIALLAIALAFIRWRSLSAWWSRKLSPETTYKGLHMARDVAFHPGHCWASIDAEVVIGADDVVQATLGPIDEVALPDTGRHVQRGEPLFRLRHADRTLELTSPVTGTVLAVNPELITHPELINDKPFSAGWIVRLHAEDLPEDRRHLLHGRRAWDWFRREVDLVMRVVPSEPDPTPDPDVSHRLHRRVDEGAWAALRAALAHADAAA